jgi:hypothetical protein
MFTRTAALAAAILLLAGCVPTIAFRVDGTAPNPRFRTDLRPLDDAQRNAVALDHGPYRIGDGDIVSPLYPVADWVGLDGRTSNLIQSDCLWLARGPSGNWGDRVEVSWEETWTIGVPELAVQRPDAERTAGMCTLTLPDTREPLPADVLNYDPDDLPATSSGAALYVASDTHALTVASAGTTVPGEPVIFACGDVRRTDGATGRACGIDELRFFGTRLKAVEPAVPDDVAHPGGACPAMPITGNDRALGATDLGDMPFVEGWLPLCQRRGWWRPSRDSRLVLSGHHIAPGYTASWGPNLMVVDGTRVLRRPVARVRIPRNAPLPDEEWSWQTPVHVAANGSVRWQENFSPSVQVGTVRVRVRNRGAPHAFPVNADLCLVGSGTQCTYTCRGVPQTDGALYALGGADCRDAMGREVTPVVTPTYVFEQLDAQPGRPQDVPLRWVLRDIPVGSSFDAVELEFTLLARGPQGAALRADHGAFDLDRVQIDRHAARQRTLLRNVGDQPVRLERLRLAGSHAQEFDAIFPGAPVPVPLPVDFDPPQQAGKPRGVGLSPSILDLPMVYAEDRDPNGIGVGRAALGKADFSLYGGPLRIERAQLMPGDADFDFVAAARQEALALNPSLSPETPLVLVRPWVALAQSARSLPITLQPGEAAELSVGVQPRALGERSAVLFVDWTPLLPGTAPPPVALSLRARSVSAAILNLVPSELSFAPRQGSTRLRRNLIVDNVGETEGTLRSLRLEGPDRALFALVAPPSMPLLLGPGAPVVVGLEALPPRCNGGFVEYSAFLRIELEDGSWHAVPLHAACRP